MYDRNWFGSTVPTRSFEECKEYDIVLRTTVRPIGNGKPRWDYENLWTFAEKVILKRKEDELAAKTRQVEAELAEMKRWRTNQANDSSREKSSPGQSFRGGKAKEEQQKTSFPFCYVCGSCEHSAYSCSATVKCVGSRGPVLLQRRGNTWAIPNVSQDRERICFRFNLPGTCRIRDCNKGQHICSLCGHSAHAAISCTA
jgi:hypothetical protein